jgi:hypothetical protein
MALSKIDIENMVTGELTTTNGGTGATSFTAGITMFDMWRLTDDATGNHEPISSNLERVDTASQSYIGSAMTQSSGIFTFPSTGIYLVTFTPVMNANSGTDYADFKIQTTTDNSSYNTMAQGFEGASTSVSYGGTILQTTVDVTNTSNVKVRFMATQSDTNNKIRGQSTYNRTMFTFMRLGDT